MVTKRFIGTLQSNKVNKCLDLFDTVDSVDSIRLAKKIDKRSKTLGKITPILLEVNTSKEKQKHGFWPDKVDDMILCTTCLLYTSQSPRDRQKYRMPSSA